MPINLRCRVNKLHESTRFIDDRQVRKEKNGEPTRILVTEIKEREGPNRSLSDMLPPRVERWRWLLSRRCA